MLVATQGNEFRAVGDPMIAAPSPGERKDYLIIETNTGRSVAFTVVNRLTAITMPPPTGERD
jgi:hypothetical protein